jgi:hypothetical protein
MKVDKKTQEILVKGQAIEDFIKSDGWQEVKKMLNKKLATLDSIGQIPDADPEKFYKEAKIREGVVSVMLEWINEVEGVKATNQQNQKVFLENKDEMIKRFE